MRRPALRIIFAPLQREAPKGKVLLGQACKRTIWLDPRKQNVGKTLLHELIHVERPSWSETQVRRETRERWRRMGWREMAELYKLLGHAEVGE